MHSISFNPPIADNYFGHIVAEIWKDKIYEPFLFGKKDLVILDIGANIGWTSYYFSQFAKQVYALEPAKEHYECLVKNTIGNGLTNVKPVNKAIWLENTKLPFYHNQNKTMYSLHQAVADPKLGTEQVETITLDKLFEDEKIEHVDLMKIDVEGSEVEILSSDGFELVASKIELIIGEVHNWSGRNPNQIKDAIKGMGFSFEIIPNQAEIFIAKRI